MTRLAEGSSVHFTILATPRSGSNMLCGLLNTHSDCVCHHELFNPKGVRLALHLRNPEPNLAGLPDRQAKPLAFMQAVMERWPGLHATGMKMTGIQDRHAFAHILATVTMRKILLKRCNTLRELVSHKIAEQLNQWEVYDGDMLVHHRPRVTVEVDELERRARVNQQHYQSIVKRLQADRQEYLEVSYERLLGNDRHTTIAGVLDFLELSPSDDLELVSVRQNPQPLNELLENYDQLRHRLSDTVYHWQLDE
ncbi:MAG: hypothetical protein LC637_03385 [Xanthomonadaceae bacterium]|nr:hypothetical protein [Xanthomonadaceae bacterium]